MPVLDAIYDALNDVEALDELPDVLAREVEARSCVFQLFSPQGVLVDHQFSYFSEDHFAFYARQELYRIDPWRVGGLGPQFFNHAVDFGDLISLDNFCATDYYHDLFVAHGDDTARCVGCCISVGDHHATLGLHRAARDKPFEERQFEFVTSIIPHLRRMALARLMFSRADRALDELKAALDAPKIGVIRVNGAGRLQYANAAGLDILDQTDGLALSGQAIRAQPEALHQRLMFAVRTACARSDNQGDAMLVPRPSGRPAWRVIVTPDRAHASDCATVLIDSPSDNAESLRANLARLYNLTAAEGEIATLLTEGWSPAEIAEKRSVSIATVRNQIKALMDKTGAARIGGLTALLASTIRSR